PRRRARSRRRADGRRRRGDRGPRAGGPRRRPSVSASLDHDSMIPDAPRGARRRASAAAARLPRPAFQTRLAARVAEPPRPPLGSHDHDPDAPEWTSTSRAPILILLGPLLMIPGMDGTGSPGPRGATSEGLGGR